MDCKEGKANIKEILLKAFLIVVLLIQLFCVTAAFSFGKQYADKFEIGASICLTISHIFLFKFIDEGDKNRAKNLVFCNFITITILLH